MRVWKCVIVFSSRSFPAPLWLHEGPMVWGCYTGSLQAETALILASLQVCLWLGRSKSKPSYTGFGGDWLARGCECGKGGGLGAKDLLPASGEERDIPTRLGKGCAAAWVRKADQRDTGAKAVAASTALASVRMKLDAWLLHLPHTPIPQKNYKVTSFAA